MTSPKPNTREALRLWRRLLAFVRPWSQRVVVAIIASIVAALATAGWAALLGPMLESVLKGGEVAVGAWQLGQSDLSVRLPLAIVGLAALKAVSSWLHAGLMTSAAQRAMSAIRRALYARLLQLPPAWFEARHSGELLSHFTSDVSQLEFSAGQALASITRDSLQVLGLLVVCLVTLA